ncbi:MAG: TRAP transporter small permease [Sulfitobacter sp.]|jgi:TRAP-type C4-dicarboxylate transport system permease small subunit|uniref:TRAP transporter small permease n=1 Tax=unclassified Sulfitobacter TaxID=196795 RepID=UPI0007C21DEF|nr:MULTISPECIES: TRAP transporter small permease [unclassified Sulfitobacter]KZZ21033.1 ABC transporter substrate-binding protein [Sulfitobacter sp. HI0082]AYE84883.1 ABC transporter substrate-binding protein [Sulfitobacter sp. D7]KZX90312.1 ABC transporter substrate-binding protein [Sulfitobacter sp. HI0021]KZY02258.1 ABC transporter substrate-binding protein [Sulfitobacter sp. HI0027]KZZ03511.1 ABC transporter substrate-binding protein [Sulfitobacter sp. HI0076]|tara:strand:- start:367 stop:891 length:525 start_codon:yes stop_codon:yes gene_type:complete
MKALRRLLDGLYIGAGALAALCLVAILTLIVAQMVARWTGNVFPGAASYAGYAMAGASFLAFANALNRGSHIRVSILLNALSTGGKRLLDIWCFAVAAAVAWYFTYYAYWFVYWSWKFNEVSQDQDATALWIPQSVMVIGGGILAIALTDNLLHLIFKGDHRVTRDLVDQSFGE